MTTRLPNPDHDALQSALARAGSLSLAAEAHGLLCGLLCADAGLPARSWREVLLTELGDIAAVDAEGSRLLDELYAATRAGFADEELGFEPLLPEDDAPLAARAEALGQWCQGFGYGLARAGERLATLGTEAREVLDDLREFAQADYETDDADEEGEAAWVELVEYLRIGVLLLYATLAAPAPTPPATGAGSRLH